MIGMKAIASDREKIVSGDSILLSMVIALTLCASAVPLMASGRDTWMELWGGFSVGLTMLVIFLTLDYRRWIALRFWLFPISAALLAVGALWGNGAERTPASGVPAMEFIPGWTSCPAVLLTIVACAAFIYAHRRSLQSVGSVARTMLPALIVVLALFVLSDYISAAVLSLGAIVLGCGGGYNRRSLAVIIVVFGSIAAATLGASSHQIFTPGSVDDTVPTAPTALLLLLVNLVFALVVVWRGVRITASAPDLFGRLTAGGMTFLVGGWAGLLLLTCATHSHSTTAVAALFLQMCPPAAAMLYRISKLCTRDLEHRFFRWPDNGQQ